MIAHKGSINDFIVQSRYEEGIGARDILYTLENLAREVLPEEEFENVLYTINEPFNFNDRDILRAYWHLE